MYKPLNDRDRNIITDDGDRNTIEYDKSNQTYVDERGDNDYDYINNNRYGSYDDEYYD